MDEETKELAEKIREICIKAAKEGFIDASISGLCTEGAVEAAISAMQMINLEKELAKTLAGNQYSRETKSSITITRHKNSNS